jgi:hypothetical protein
MAALTTNSETAAALRSAADQLDARVIRFRFGPLKLHHSRPPQQVGDEQASGPRRYSHSRPRSLPVAGPLHKNRHIVRDDSGVIDLDQA